VAFPCSQWIACSPVRNWHRGRPLNGIVRFQQGGSVAKYRIGVLLFDEAAEVLKPSLYPRYMKHNKLGYYLNCDEIDASGPFLTMTISSIEGITDPDTIEVHIQYSWVKLTMKVKGRNPFGFAET
jgi:hypothetical protein